LSKRVTQNSHKRLSCRRSGVGVGVGSGVGSGVGGVGDWGFSASLPASSLGLLFVRRSSFGQGSQSQCDCRLQADFCRFAKTMGHLYGFNKRHYCKNTFDPNCRFKKHLKHLGWVAADGDNAEELSGSRGSVFFEFSNMRLQGDGGAKGRSGQSLQLPPRLTIHERLTVHESAFAASDRFQRRGRRRDSIGQC